MTVPLRSATGTGDGGFAEHGLSSLHGPHHRTLRELQPRSRRVVNGATRGGVSTSWPTKHPREAPSAYGGAARWRQQGTLQLAEDAEALEGIIVRTTVSRSILLLPSGVDGFWW